MADNEQVEEKQCRICLDGPEAHELGRLIRPCLCRGSISVNITFLASYFIS